MNFIGDRRSRRGCRLEIIDEAIKFATTGRAGSRRAHAFVTRAGAAGGAGLECRKADISSFSPVFSIGTSSQRMTITPCFARTLPIPAKYHIFRTLLAPLLRLPAHEFDARYADVYSAVYYIGPGRLFISRKYSKLECAASIPVTAEIGLNRC